MIGTSYVGHGTLTRTPNQQRVDGWWWMHRKPTPQQLKLEKSRISCEHNTHTQKAILKPMMRNVWKSRTCKTQSPYRHCPVFLQHQPSNFETQQLTITVHRTGNNGFRPFCLGRSRPPLLASCRRCTETPDAWWMVIVSMSLAWVRLKKAGNNVLDTFGKH